MTIKVCALLALIFAESQLASAQFDYPKTDDAMVVLGKTLAVELHDEIDEIDRTQNESLRRIFSENWTLTPVEFFYSTELQGIKSSGGDYAYLVQQEALKEITRSRNYQDSDASYNYVAFTFQYYPFRLQIFHQGKIKTVASITFASADLHEIDHLFLYQQLDRLISFASKNKKWEEYYGDIETNIEKVKASTLLMPEVYYTAKDAKKMPSLYSYPHEIVGLKAYENSIKSLEKGKSYIRIIWSDLHGVYMWVAVDCETGQVLSQVGFGGIEFGKNHTANEIIKGKHMKYLTSVAAQEINTRRP